MARANALMLRGANKSPVGTVPDLTEEQCVGFVKIEKILDSVQGVKSVTEPGNEYISPGKIVIEMTGGATKELGMEIHQIAYDHDVPNTVVRAALEKFMDTMERTVSDKMLMLNVFSLHSPSLSSRIIIVTLL